MIKLKTESVKTLATDLCRTVRAAGIHPLILSEPFNRFGVLPRTLFGELYFKYVGDLK